MLRRSLRVLAIAGVLLVAALWLFRSSHEPRYRDASLSFWMAALDRPADHAAAVEALDAIGVEAIPTLLSYLGQADSQFGRKLSELAGRVGIFKRPAGPEYSATSRRKQAVFAFERLGPRARIAIPSLLRLTESHDSALQTDAWRALAGVVGDNIDRYLTTKPVSTRLRTYSVTLSNALPLGNSTPSRQE